jgi:ferredoxin--NADP+ reductase
VAAGAVPTLDEGVSTLDALLAERGVTVTTWADWQTLDKAEQARGAAQGRPRVKLTSVPEMLEIVAAAH